MTASDADWAAAHALWNEILCNGGVPGWTARDAIAAALAEARATERAVADQLRADVEKAIQELDDVAAMNDETARSLRSFGARTRHLGLRDASRDAAARLRAILDAR